MIKLTEGNIDKYISVHHPLITKALQTREEVQQLKQQIIQNQELRDIIVDLADLWDGKISQKYGNRLQNVLDKLGIKDIPKGYGSEYTDSIIKELQLENK